MSDPNRSIMVVEDDEDIRDMLRLVLESCGYRVEMAPDGLAGWEHLAADHVPSLIILDLMMPRMNGEQFLRKLRASPQASIPVVIMSGQPGATQTARDLEADAAITKPVDLDDLLSTVERLVA
jgi:CheY-like chemotaxis protein